MNIKRERLSRGGSLLSSLNIVNSGNLDIYLSRIIGIDNSQNRHTIKRILHNYPPYTYALFFKGFFFLNRVGFAREAS